MLHVCIYSAPAKQDDCALFDKSMTFLTDEHSLYMAQVLFSDVEGNQI